MNSNYIVYLLPGHSLADHVKKVSPDLMKHVDHVYSFITDQVVYVGKGVDASLLAAIKADTNVETVEVQSEDMPTEF